MRLRNALLTTLSVLAIFALSESANALPTISGKITSNGGSPSRVVLQQSSKNNSSSVSNNKFKVKGKSSGNRLTLIKNDGRVGGPVVFGIKSGNKVWSVSKAREKGLCGESDARGVMAVRKVRKKRKSGSKVSLKGLSFETESNFAHTKRVNGGKADTRSRYLSQVDSNCAPTGATLGINQTPSSDQRVRTALHSEASISPDDIDGDGIDNSLDYDDDNDGMPDAFDIDDDADGILDNDDPDSQGSQEGLELNERRFWVFSNFHLSLEDSLNVNAMEVTKELIDDRLVNNAGLAFQVVGGGDFDVELDCGLLSYCSEGGTGRTREPYPDGLKFPEEVDADSDGLGTITPGSSGDFQFAPNANSDELRAGDVYIQRIINGSGKEVEVPGMLYFLFHTTPAAKSVTTDVQSYTLSYPVASGADGTPGNCFEVPASGDVNVTLEVFRPQRPGVSAAGEAAFVDMGNLRLVTNIPNGPCVVGGDGQCSSPSTGPGLCSPSVYSTSDPNLTAASDGLQDTLGDVAANPSNTFNYSMSLSDCLSNAGIAWNAGETLMVPLQMMNVFGDNAAQNLCFKRKSS